MAVPSGRKVAPAGVATVVAGQTNKGFLPIKTNTTKPSHQRADEERHQR